MPKLPRITGTAVGGSDADIAFVTRLAGLLTEANIAEIEVERAGLKVRVSRNGGAGAPLMYAPQPAAAPAAPAPTAKPPVPAETDLSKHPGAVLSPMVGTAYLAPQPGAAAFVKVGDEVKEDQTLLIVEAMKTMNPIPAPRAGRIVQILVADTRPVEYGEVLMIIE
jgi:acetyl-CoA carboxylase biotin carboxyl carrier protein